MFYFFLYSGNDEIEVSFYVERFGSQKKGRVVKYDLKTIIFHVHVITQIFLALYANIFLKLQPN
jgi:hypothetical protein